MSRGPHRPDSESGNALLAGLFHAEHPTWICIAGILVHYRQDPGANAGCKLPGFVPVSRYVRMGLGVLVHFHVSGPFCRGVVCAR